MDFKAEKLANSHKFDNSLWSEDKKIDLAIDEMLDHLKTRAGLTGQERLLKRHLKVLLLNLLCNWKAAPEIYTSYNRGSNHYSSIDKRYNRNKISRKLIEVVDAMITLGWVENSPGHNYRTGKKQSHISRMKASKLLESEFHRLSISSFCVSIYKNAECIIMRERSKIAVAYKDTARTTIMRRDLEKYNDLIRHSSIGLPASLFKTGPLKSKGKNITINFNDIFTRRIFNNRSWNQGGRFYGGWWQRLSKELRKKILIEKTPVIEIDFKGFHIVLLYALEGIDLLEGYKYRPL